MEMEEKASYGASSADMAEAATEAPKLDDAAAPVAASAPPAAAEPMPIASTLASPILRKAMAAKSASQAADSLQTFTKKEAADMSSRTLAGRVAGVSVANTSMPTAPAIYPAPVGGTTALHEYLRRSATEFDPEINNLRLNGNVRVKFLVGADGKLSNLKVSRGLRADYDAEALRIVCEGPAWTPGIAGGKRAPIPMEVTVPF
jgi:outer membrane biosynthesis protein TonB